MGRCGNRREVEEEQKGERGCCPGVPWESTRNSVPCGFRFSYRRIAVTAVMGCVRYLGLEASPAQERQEQTGVLHKILKRVVAPYA